MERKLITSIPNKILNGFDYNSLIRYDQITDIMVNEYGYKLIKTGYHVGRKYWILERDTINENNSEMGSFYYLGGYESHRDMLNKTFGPIVKHLQETKNQLNVKKD
jgi:hypothetical protein